MDTWKEKQSPVWHRCLWPFYPTRAFFPMPLARTQWQNGPPTTPSVGSVKPEPRLELAFSSATEATVNHVQKAAGETGTAGIRGLGGIKDGLLMTDDRSSLSHKTNELEQSERSRRAAASLDTSVRNETSP